MIVDIEAYVAVNAMLTEFAYRIDNGHASTVPELCHESMSFFAPMGDSPVDYKAFAESMIQRQEAPHRTRHQISNVRINRVSPDSIEATVVMSVTRIEPVDGEHSKESVVVADWEVTLLRDGSDYKFSRFAFTVFSMNEYAK